MGLLDEMIRSRVMGGGTKEPFTRKQAELLRQRMAELHNPPAVKVGDIVQMRAGLRTGKSGLKIVTEIFSDPIRRAGEAGSNHEFEILTGKIGALDSDGDLSEFYVDLRRFEPVDVDSLPDDVPSEKPE